MAPVTGPTRHPARQLPRTVQSPVRPMNSTSWRMPSGHAKASESQKTRTAASIDDSTRTSTRIDTLDPVLPHGPSTREWSVIELEPFRAQFDEWYIDKRKSLLEIQQLFSLCGFNVR